MLNAIGVPTVAAVAFGDWVIGLGDGAGGFTGITQLPLDLITSGVAVDVNGDGAADVLASSSFGTSVVLLNDGTGTFAASAPFASTNFTEIAVADVDADGLIDVIGTGSGGIAVFTGDGNGGFTAAEPPVGPVTTDLTVADVDANGRVDVLALEANANAFVLRRGALPTPAGVTSFGVGTPNCAGTIGIWATPEPRPDTPDFRVACSNVPRDRNGVLLIGISGDVNGVDLPGLGVKLHVGPLSLPYPLRSDVGGTASASLPIPPFPFAPWFPIYLQSFWLGDASAGDTCSPAMFELSSSRGLEVRVQ